MRAIAFALSVTGLSALALAPTRIGRALAPTHSGRASRTSTILLSTPDTAPDYAEWQDFNVGRWRGRARSVRFDRDRPEVDALLDGQRYLTSVSLRGTTSSYDEEFEWDNETLGVDELFDIKRSSADFAADVEGSYSLDHNIHTLAKRPSYFTVETSIAVRDDERVRVIVAYDIRGALARVTALTELRPGAQGSSDGASRVDSSSLGGLCGEWNGDAVVRRKPKGDVLVAKQKLVYRVNGDQFLRRLEIMDGRGESVQQIDTFGQIATGPTRDSAFEVVKLEDASVLVLLRGGAYALAPLRIVGDAGFLIEAGVLVDESDDAATSQAQLPISLRGDGDDEPSSSRRFLTRSCRLYRPKGALASVTTSYHQLEDLSAGVPAQ